MTVLLGTFAVGLALKKLLDHLFDYIVYPLALMGLGYGWGVVVMTGASIVINIAILWTYDWARRDLLLIEALKSLQRDDAKDGWARGIAKVMAQGRLASFFVLSLVEDAAVATLYLRKGAHLYNGLSRVDWLVFCASTFLSNILWALSVGSVIEAGDLLAQVLDAA